TSTPSSIVPGGRLANSSLLTPGGSGTSRGMSCRTGGGGGPRPPPTAGGTSVPTPSGSLFTPPGVFVAPAAGAPRPRAARPGGGGAGPGGGCRPQEGGAFLEPRPVRDPGVLARRLQKGGLPQVVGGLVRPAVPCQHLGGQAELLGRMRRLPLAPQQQRVTDA